MKIGTLLAVVALALTGCSSPTRPDASSPAGQAGGVGATAAKPGYEPAYYDGSTVTINAIEVPQNTGPLTNAAADFYQVAYPPDTSLWPSVPQCNPCDHEQNGIQFTDYHDHVLDSIPADPGHGEYNALWRVWVVVPADMSPQGQAAYAARLPMKSEDAINAAVQAGVAREIDTRFYFICAVVSANAVH